MGRSSPNASLFWPILVVVVIVDQITKWMAERFLVPMRVPHEVIGETVRLTLVYNPGAAFGLHVGPYSRWIFMVLTIGALFILGRLYVTTLPGDRPRTIALALVCAGAVGNLIDRIHSAPGVIDFVDIGIGQQYRWPTFNVADMAVSIGAFLLAWVLWGEDTEAAAAASAPARLPSEP